jgi:hypothetical protein
MLVLYLKAVKKTDGLGKFYNGSTQATEKGLEISLLSLVDIKTKTGYALDAVQTIDKEGGSRVVLYANQVVGLANSLIKKGINHLVADAYYFKKNLYILS